MPKDSLVILTLSNGNIHKIPAVKSFQIPEFGNDLIAYLSDPKTDIKKEGANLYFRDLNSGQERVYSNITDYAMHPKGEGLMMYQIKTKANEAAAAKGNLAAAAAEAEEAAATKAAAAKEADNADEARDTIPTTRTTPTLPLLLSSMSAVQKQAHAPSRGDDSAAAASVRRSFIGKMKEESECGSNRRKKHTSFFL
jgi:hypothetical protein